MKEIILIVILLAGIVAIFKLGKPKKKKEEDIQPVTRQKLTVQSQLDIVEATVKSLVICIDDDEKQFGGKVLGWLTKDRYYIESIVATIRASVDMEDFSEDDIKQDNLHKTITINLPCPTVGKVNFPTEKGEVIWKKGGKFEPDEVNELRKQKQKDINEDKEIRDIIMKRAKQNAQNIFRSKLINLGFADANIYFKKETKTEQ